MPGSHEVITIGGNLLQAQLCEQENYDITTVACQPLEPRFTWATTAGAMLEPSSEGQPPGVGPNMTSLHGRGGHAQ
jgi:hypothetical protein